MDRIRLIFTILLCFTFLNAFSQMDRAQLRAKERVENMRIGIITSRLNLTPAEAEKFWPLYNEYRKKLDSLYQKRIRLIEAGINNSDSIASLTDNEAEKLMSELLQINEETVKVQMEYYKKFSKLIGPKRTIDLYLSEIQFKRKIVREIRELKNE